MVSAGVLLTVVFSPKEFPIIYCIWQCFNVKALYAVFIMYVAQLMRESSTTSNDFLPHASLSLDYGSDSPVSQYCSLSLCMNPLSNFPPFSLYSWRSSKSTSTVSRKVRGRFFCLYIYIASSVVLFPGFTPVFPVSESAFDESPTTEMRERLGSSLTYEQQVGLSSTHVCLCVGGVVT